MKTDVLIVGAGLVGASLAAALQGRGVDVMLLDAGSPQASFVGEWDTRIYAISPGSRDFLQASGAWSRIPADRIAHVEGMEVHGDDAAAMISFSAYQAGLRELCCIVESRAIQHALVDAIEATGEITCLFGARPMALAVDERYAQVDLEDGRSVEARLVVGADGAQSWVREAIGIEARIRPYNQQGVVANFETERGHGNVARQWFRSDGALALLPLPGNRVSMVWSTWDAAAERLLGLEGDSLAREVGAASAQELGELRVLARARAFPLRWMRAHETVRPRIALVGDAAHNVHPLAGQGVNLGFQDAEMLVSVIGGRGAQDDCGDYRLLRRYARSRSEPVAMMQATTDALQRLFNNEVSGLKWLRNAGLKLTNGVVPAKSLFVAHALG